MKMNNRYIKLFTVVLVAILFSGCLNELLPEKELTYQGESQLEFKPQTETYAEDEGTVNLKVQLIGPQRDSDLSVAFSVNADKTDAVAGTHYSLATPSPVTLTANSSSATVTLNLNGTSLDAGQTRTLVLTLDESNKVKPAPNLKSSTITIEGVDGN